MANRKISDLTALTTTATGDLLPIVDISEAAAADKNKKITVENLFKGIPGNVGIGTSSPGSKLEIRNDVAATTSLDATAIKLYNNLDGGSGIEFLNAVAGKSKISFGVESSGAGTNETYLGFSTCLEGGALTERVRIDSSGRVGIGTSSPGAPLEVVAASSAGVSTVARFRHDNGADQHYLDVSVNPDTDTVKFISSGSANGSLVLGTAAVDTLTTTSAGRVGIGTSSPSHKLDVAGGVNSTGLNATGTGGFFNSASKFGVDNNGGVTRMYSSGPDASTRGSFDFRTTDSVGTLDTSRMVIDSSGNVGIGTSSPTGLLTVATATAGTAADFVIGNPANLWSIKTGTTTNALTIVDTQFSVERLRIDSSGRLLVGTSSDSGGALLQVNGDRIRVGTAKTPASASATGTTGEICWDANYIYVCTATNTWKRTAIATW